MTSKKITVSDLFIHGFLMSVVAVNLFPVLWMISSSLKTQEEVFGSASLIPSQLHWENYVFAWTNGNFQTYFANSLLYTAATLIGVILISSMAAYAFAQANFKGSKILFYFFVASMMIPIPGAFIPLYVLLIKLDLANTRLGMPVWPRSPSASCRGQATARRPRRGGSGLPVPEFAVSA